MIEYPVKTINVSERDRYYQVDTGPVLFPDLSIGHESFVGNFRLAYIAHNCADWAEIGCQCADPPSPRVFLSTITPSLCVWKPENSMIELE